MRDFMSTSTGKPKSADDFWTTGAIDYPQPATPERAGSADSSSAGHQAATVTATIAVCNTILVKA